MNTDIAIVGVGVWTLTIAGIDTWRQKVPNLLLVLALVPAVLAVAVNGHGLLGAGVWASVAGFAIGGLVTLPGYVLHKMGAGDVKLAMVLGLLSGFPGVISWLLYGFIVLGLMSAVAMAARHYYGAPWSRIPAASAFVAGFLAWLAWGGLPLLARV